MPVESVLDAVVEAGLTAIEIYTNNIHHASEQSVYLLNLLKKARCSGFVVYEAKESYQTKHEFKTLYDFLKNWKDNSL